MSKRAQAENSAGSDSIDSDSNPSPTKRRAIALDKGKGKAVEISNAKEPARGNVYTRIEKDWLIKRREDVQEDWKETAKAFRIKFPSKADVTNRMVEHVHTKWAYKLAVERGETTRTMQKFTGEHCEFVVSARKETSVWLTIATSFRTRFPDREGVYASGLWELFQSIQLGRNPERWKGLGDLQKRALAYPLSKRPLRKSKTVDEEQDREEDTDDGNDDDEAKKAWLAELSEALDDSDTSELTELDGVLVTLVS